MVEQSNLDMIESRLQEINRTARMLRCEHTRVPIEQVLGLSAFDLDTVLERRPTFLQPEYPFEWCGVFA